MGNVNELKPIKTLLPEEINYNKIKAVISYYLVREHLRSLGLDYEEFEGFPYESEEDRDRFVNEKLDEFLRVADLIKGDGNSNREKDNTDNSVNGKYGIGISNEEKKIVEKEEKESPKKKTKCDMLSLLDSPPRLNDDDTDSDVTFIDE